MPQHFNSFNGIGNLTREPDLDYTPNDTAVCDLGLAINNPWTDTDDDTVFVDCTVWGKEAENANKYLETGQTVFVDGRLDYDQWEQDGKKRSKLFITADRLIYLHSSNGSSSEKENKEETMDDDIPF